MDVKDKKQVLREKMSQLRNSFSQTQVEQSSKLIVSNCIGGLKWQSIKSIQVYLPIKIFNEVNTWPLLEKIWEKYPNVNTYVPIIRNGELFSATISKDSELRSGQLGILEPRPASLISGNKEFDAIMVPTLAFDRQGYRLGYGIGHYDKFLSTYKGIKMGLAYIKCEVTSGLPTEKHDVVLDYIVTEKEVIIPSLT